MRPTSQSQRATDTARFSPTSVRSDCHRLSKRLVAGSISFLCLTLELSGGAAVRLNEKLGACAAPCLGDCASTTACPTERNASSFGCLKLAAASKGKRPSAED